MSKNIVEIRPDSKEPANMNKCKLFVGATEIINIQPIKLLNEHGLLILKAEIRFDKRSVLKTTSETVTTTKGGAE